MSKTFQEGALRFIFKATSCLNIILYLRRCGGAREMQGSKLLGQKEHIISTPKVWTTWITRLSLNIRIDKKIEFSTFTAK